MMQRMVRNNGISVHQARGTAGRRTGVSHAPRLAYFGGIKAVASFYQGLGRL